MILEFPKSFSVKAFWGFFLLGKQWHENAELRKLNRTAAIHANVSNVLGDSAPNHVVQLQCFLLQHHLLRQLVGVCWIHDLFQIQVVQVEHGFGVFDTGLEQGCFSNS